MYCELCIIKLYLHLYEEICDKTNKKQIYSEMAFIMNLHLWQVDLSINRRYLDLDYRSVTSSFGTFFFKSSQHFIAAVIMILMDQYVPRTCIWWSNPSLWKHFVRMRDDIILIAFLFVIYCHHSLLDWSFLKKDFLFIYWTDIMNCTQYLYNMETVFCNSSFLCSNTFR